MTDLLFWFLISQTLSSLPDMQPGTTVQLVSTDLLSVYAMAQVQDRELVFQGEVYAGSEVRVLIFLPNSEPRATVEALGHKALYARVSSDGTDILVQFESLDGPLSFRKWLAEERGITLVMPAESRE